MAIATGSVQFFMNRMMLMIVMVLNKNSLHANMRICNEFLVIDLMLRLLFTSRFALVLFFKTCDVEGNAVVLLLCEHGTHLALVSVYGFVFPNIRVPLI